MAFTVSIHHGAYALAVATGPAMVCDMLGLLEMVGRVTTERGNDRALLDLLAVEVQFPETDHERIGIHAALVLSHLRRVAVVVSEEFRVGSGERSAVEAGLPVKTFTDLTLATEWMDEG